MKYYIGFPISLHCNLRCPYCFNQEFYNFIDKKIGTNKWRDKRTFTLEDYRKWRDDHLIDASDIVMHLFGGEPFCQPNVEDVFSIIDFMDKEHIDILSNGICDSSILERLKQYKHKIHRVGFTYHRKVLEGMGWLTDKFISNVQLVHQMGIPVYVKELLIKEYRDAIIEHKRWWLSQGIDFKIQDFKGQERGISQEEVAKYTPLDRLLVDPEYKHRNPCSCIFGYKNLFIRGFDMVDVGTNGSDIVACWHDPTVVGNILEDWFTSNYIIVKKPDGTNDVKFVKKLYRGTYERDLPKLESS